MKTCSGTHNGVFQFLLILDLWGISFHAVKCYMGEEILNFTLGTLDATLPAQSVLDKLTRQALGTPKSARPNRHAQIGTPKIRPEMIGNMNLVACGIFLQYLVI